MSVLSLPRSFDLSRTKKTVLVCIRYLRKNSGPLFNEASVLACTGATEPALRNGRRSQRARAGRALGLAKYARADALAELVTKAR